MAVVVDQILGAPLLHDHPLKNVTSDPASGKSGAMILNTTDHKIKVYYSNQWQVLHTLTAATPGTGEGMGLLLSLTYA